MRQKKRKATEKEIACVAAVSFPFPNAREREENYERVAHSRHASSVARFSFACSISAPPEKGKESAAMQAKKETASAPSRFASLFEGEMQQILTDRHSGKTKQMTNWSVSTFKGKLKFFRLKLVKYKLQLSTESSKENQFLFCIMFCLTRILILLSVFRVGFDAQFHRPVL